MAKDDDSKQKNNELKSFRSGVLSRGWAVAKLAAGTGLKSGWHQINSRFIDGNQSAERLKKLIEERANAVASELSFLKGSLMKVGQQISVYGEAFLPPEANAVLKKLQNQSAPLAWEAVSKLLRQRLGDVRYDQLEWNPKCIGSASLGQVHSAVEKATGRKLAVKLRYPGVENAIDSDLKLLRTLLGTLKLVPMTPKLDAVFQEVRSMLLQEVDYECEARNTKRYRETFAAHPEYVIPEVVDAYCAPGVLTTTFEEGVAVDGPAVAELSQERRDRLGQLFLKLYFEELFVHHQVQTDPHFGNYRVRLGKKDEPDKWVLLDFGAVRTVPAELIARYRKMVRGAQIRDEQLFFEGAKALGLVEDGDSTEFRETLRDACYLILEPFMNDEEPYDWGTTDLARRLVNFKPKFLFEARLPPGPMISVDRKTGGVFIVLAKLRARLKSRTLLESYLVSQS